MGIRTLHRQTAPAQANTDATASTPAVHIPPFSAAASTPRIPRDLAMTLRRTATDVRHRLTRRDLRTDLCTDLRLWADQARGYLALLLGALPRSRPMRTMTVFIATVGTVTDASPGSGSTATDSAPGSAPGRTVTDAPGGSAPGRSGRARREPEPDATP
ncbi:hypothetical protein OG866_32785 [Streptomyces sp. NBC_00663]|uniref:hypothetical protein n=1 Tax=Streptomyces sp. NBC_00663 TaxID=2975801 RepID=UPI002E331787|nr:hypothetical protein [Streptomyces sp. NBC_00663]